MLARYMLLFCHTFCLTHPDFPTINVDAGKELLRDRILSKSKIK